MATEQALEELGWRC